ncbi:MAG: hypothetical protein H0V01_10785 [Bacteroidetes bacterium]|nr:hypothetical protein [Bacteroidota bacterium]HET6243847.1 RHS repeat-associated core domain-containing protein [Bacteroidia bacterium]
MGALKLTYNQEKPLLKVVQGTFLSEKKGCAVVYRYAFNGMEKDDEVKGSGNSYTTEWRQYDPRLGRWLSRDPKLHPWQSPYAAFNNNPIYFVDPSGLEGEDPKDKVGQEHADKHKAETGKSSSTDPKDAYMPQWPTEPSGNAPPSPPPASASRDNTNIPLDIPNFTPKANKIPGSITVLDGGTALIPYGWGVSRSRIDFGNVNSLWANNYIKYNNSEKLIGAGAGTTLQKGSINIYADPWADIPSLLEQSTSYSRYYGVGKFGNATFGIAVINAEEIMDYQLYGAGVGMSFPFTFGIASATVVQIGHTPTRVDSIRVAKNNPFHLKSIEFKKRNK